jgi:hypothetical protein
VEVYDTDPPSIALGSQFLSTKGSEDTTVVPGHGSSSRMSRAVAELVEELAVVSARAVAGERALDTAFGPVEWEVLDDGSGRDALRVAKRVADAEREAGLAQYRFEVLRARRSARIGVAFGDSLKPREWLRFPGRLRHAVMRHEVPVRPVPVDYREVMGQISPMGSVFGLGGEPDYPYLRVAHWGPGASFGSMAPHRRIESASDIDDVVEVGADLVLIEPVRGYAPPGFLVDRVERIIDAGIPVVLFARSVEDLDLAIATSCTTVLTDDAHVSDVARERFGDRVLSVAPFVDDTVYNPIDWQRVPDETSAAVFLSATKPSTNHPALDDLIRSDAVVYQIGDQPVSDVAAFVARAKQHLVAIVDPTHFVSEASFLEQVVRLVACGTPVITAASPNLDVVFPDDDLLDVVDTPDKAKAAFDRLMADDANRERRSIRSRQFVLQNHTARHRFDTLLDRHDIPTQPDPLISILLVTKRPDFLEHAIEQISSQSYLAKELVIVLHGDDFDLDYLRGLTATCDFPTTIIQKPGTIPYGDCLNAAIDNASGDLVTKMDDDDYYGPHHLTDLTTALHYSQADIVGKRSNFTIFEDLGIGGLWNGEWTEKPSNHLPGATMLAPSALFEFFHFGRVGHGVDTNLLRRARIAGSSTYSTHPYNFVRVRHGDHTFTRSDVDFLQKTERLERNLSPKSVYI